MSKFVRLKIFEMETTAIKHVDIPDGTYKGFWSGYDVLIEGYENIKIKASDGIKGTNIPCIVQIKDKEVRIESLI